MTGINASSFNVCSVAGVVYRKRYGRDWAIAGFRFGVKSVFARFRTTGESSWQVEGRQIPLRARIGSTGFVGSGTVWIFGGASVRASRLVSSLAPPNCTTTDGRGG